MSPTSRLKLRLFAFFALWFAPVTALVSWSISRLFGDDESLARILVTSGIGGLLYGAAMAIFVGRAHIRGVRNHASLMSDEVLGVRQVRSLVLAAPVEDLFEHALQTVQALPRARITTVDRNGGVIEARVPASWKSWGELVSVRVSRTPMGETSVSIASRPSFRFTVADYGTNLGNVVAIERALRLRAGELDIQ
jgi:hypothetical protein